MFICCVSVSAQTKAFEAAGELLKVLAAPARLAIVMELADQPRFVHELVERLGMSQPLVSQHLRVLRGARLVGVERHGRGPRTPWPTSTSRTSSPTPSSTARRSRDSQLSMTIHAAHQHDHGPGCGHASVEREGHADYVHEGHAHAPHDGHYDEHPLPHLAHAGHDHVHGPGCGHEAVAARRPRRLRA